MMAVRCMYNVRKHISTVPATIRKLSAMPDGCIHQINEQVRPWVDLIDKLRALGIEKDIAIPQIAVMGDQSSGKSSVLEALSGVQFPRGAGMVKRCATELRMKNRKDAQWSARVSLTWNDPQPAEAGEVDCPDQIGDKIKKLTDVLILARGSTFESEHSILIELTSPDVPDLTIIDLPGIVRTTLEGQSKTVIAEVSSLLQKYMEQDRTIILAVVPSNVDIATVDIIERASKADPNGKRTLGVLTKPDMIDEGAEKEVVDTLKNRTKPLRLGYIMVKNRSQLQIKEGFSLSEARAQERSYFHAHPVFGTVDPSLFCHDNLAKKLTSILVDKIKESLPQMLKESSKQKEEAASGLEQLGEAPPQNPDSARRALQAIVQRISVDIRGAISGEYGSPLLYSTPSLRIFARFRTSTEAFNEAVLKDRPSWTTEQLKDVVAKMRGRELPGFPKPAVLTFLVGEYVNQWEKRALALLQETEELTQEAAEAIVDHHTRGCSRLGSLLKSGLADLAMEARTETQRVLLEQVLPNERKPMTLNHYLMDTYNKQRQDQRLTDIGEALDHFINHIKHSGKTPATLSDSELVTLKAQAIGSHQGGREGSQANETQEAEQLGAMLMAYWKTSSKRFIDTAVQNIDGGLLRRLDAECASNMHSIVEGSGAEGDSKWPIEILEEDQEVREQRLGYKARLERLTNAQELILERLPGLKLARRLADSDSIKQPDDSKAQSSGGQ